MDVKHVQNAIVGALMKLYGVNSVPPYLALLGDEDQAEGIVMTNLDDADAMRVLCEALLSMVDGDMTKAMQALEAARKAGAN